MAVSTPTEDTHRCLACAGLEFSSGLPYRLTHASHGGLFGSRQIRTCVGCGLPQVYPLPSQTELDHFYDTTYRTGGFNAAYDLSQYPFDSAWKLSRGRALRNLAEQHPRAQKDRLRILDIGAGFGHTLHAFREVHPHAKLVAIEGDPTCLKPLANSGATVITGFWGQPGVAESAVTHGPYDIVILSHVLEHVRDPVAFLQAVKAMAPRACLLIEVPNEGHTVALVAHSPHTAFFDRDTLTNLVRRAGLAVVWIGAAGPPIRSPARPLPPAPTLSNRVAACLPDPLRRRLSAFATRLRSAVNRRTADNDAWRPPVVIPIPEFDVYRDDGMFLRAVVLPNP